MEIELHYMNMMNMFKFTYIFESLPYVFKTFIYISNAQLMPLVDKL